MDVAATALERVAKAAEAAGMADRVITARHDLSHSFPDGTFDLVSACYFHTPVDIPRAAGFGDSAALLANVVNGVINVIMTIVAVRLLDRVGRRPLLLIGTAGMALGMIVAAVSFLGGAQLTGAWAVVAVIALFFYTGSFAIGLGPVFWLLIAEIYPLTIRGAAMSVATMANWAANFVVTITFLTLLGAIGGVGTFLMFAILTLMALGYFWRKVPETKGRSLQQIERDLAVDPAAVPG